MTTSVESILPENGLHAHRDALGLSLRKIKPSQLTIVTDEQYEMRYSGGKLFLRVIHGNTLEIQGYASSSFGQVTDLCPHFEFWVDRNNTTHFQGASLLDLAGLTDQAVILHRIVSSSKAL